MVKIKSSGKIVGRSPFSRGAVKGAFTGRKVGKGTISGRSTKRLMVRDPSKGGINAGTSRDFNPLTKNATIRVPRPRILKAPQTAVRGAGSVRQSATPSGVRKIIARSNRAVRRTNK